MTSFSPSPPPRVPPAARKGPELPVHDYEGGFEDMHAGLRPRFRELLLRECKPGQTVALDVGCGSGRVAFFLASHVKHVVGIDVDAKAIEAARAKARSIGVSARAEFVVADADKTPYGRFRQDGFDLVATNLAFSEAVVAHAAAALPAGGAIVFCCMGKDQFAEIDGAGRFTYAEAQIRDAAARAGLAVETLEREAFRVRFKSIQEAREALGPERTSRWLSDGRWDRLASNFAQGKRTLTESRIVGLLRR
ncbi:MAG TPA: methyltransferase domain-containing protein [Candidatus Thermoplasmatota archaeon]|nr:methyltransferase domain-containing protein [Candidatus Thermoplasmatota archaeon]